MEIKEFWAKGIHPFNSPLLLRQIKIKITKFISIKIKFIYPVRNY